MNKIERFVRLAIGQPYVAPFVHERRINEWLLMSGFKQEHVKPQPNGKNNPPDYEVFYKGMWRSVEAKTSKRSQVSFNDSIPDPNTLYVFSSQQYDDTMVFYGFDVFDKRLLKLNDGYRKEIRVVLDKYRRLFSISADNPNGFVPGHRPRWTQRGGAERTDFFQPKKRMYLENRARQRAGSI